LRETHGKGEFSYNQSNLNRDLKDIMPWDQTFYPADEFSVKNHLLSKAISLDFPDTMFISRNYYEKSWSLKTHRRLKNIIVIMDFSPSKAAMVEITDVGKAFTPIQEQNLKRAFQIADRGNSGGISVGELKEVLRAVDVGLEGEEGDKFFANMNNLDQSRTFSFNELKRMLTERLAHRVQANRHYVALCLAEAECMRAVIHYQSGVPLVPGKDTIAALRTGQTLLDSSTGFEMAKSHQDTSAMACFRFIDNAMDYTPRDLSILLRSLQKNPCKNRENFFVEVRTNRRRKEIDPATSSLAKVFVTSDEHHLLQYRIAKGRVTALLKARGLFARDAFASFDNDRDGLLSRFELLRGLEWLGMKIDSSLVDDIMREVDSDRDGYINLEEFKESFGWDEEAHGTEVGEFTALPLPPMPSTEGNKVTVRIPAPVLTGIKVKIKKVTKFQLVWTSKGSMSRQQVSVWEPIVGTGAFRANRAYVSLGHYIGTGYENPCRDNRDRLTLEVTDTQGSFVGGSSWLPHVLDKYMPRPARFRLAWSVVHGSNSFYAWEPIAPNDNFIALGFVGTKSDIPPNVRVMRCVCKDWLTSSKFVHKVWDDSGSGGREGSIWVFNTLNLVGFVAGHDPPVCAPLDLKSRRFFLRDYSDITKG